MKFLLLALSISLVSCAHSSNAKRELTAPPSQVLNAWLQWEPGQILQARALVTLEKCPTMETDAGPVEMNERSSVQKDFPQKVCQANLPEKATTAKIGPLTLKAKRQINRVVVLGDTGCRLKAGKNGKPGSFQACDDPNQWPFQEVSLSAARLNPDLVIHTGDFHYREAPCPPDQKGCQGSSHGYGWKPWDEDFFTPARSLLTTAPWIFVRGNHEDCRRAGEGWLRYLAPGAPQTCTEKIPNFTVDFASHEMAVVDVASSRELQLRLSELKETSKHRWLLIHRPFLTTGSTSDFAEKPALAPVVLTPGQVSLALVGHVHVLSLNQFSDLRPIEMIVGNGGTALDTSISFMKKEKGDQWTEFWDFGFLVFDRKGESQWDVAIYNRQGNVHKKCELREFKKKKSQLKCPSR
jgi:hypothetical protein